MPFQSKAQLKAAFAGGLGPKMKKRAKLWAEHTPNIKDLPEHADVKKSFWVPEWEGEIMSLDEAYDLVKGRGKDRVKRKKRVSSSQKMDRMPYREIWEEREQKDKKRTMADMPGRIPGYSLG